MQTLDLALLALLVLNLAFALKPGARRAATVGVLLLAIAVLALCLLMAGRSDGPARQAWLLAPWLLLLAAAAVAAVRARWN